MTLQTRQPGVKGLQADDAVSDVGPTLPDQARQFGGQFRAMSGVAPARDPGGVLKRDVETAQIDDQAQVIDIRSPVFAIGVVPASGPR